MHISLSTIGNIINDNFLITTVLYDYINNRRPISHKRRIQVVLISFLYSRIFFQILKCLQI